MTHDSEIHAGMGSCWLTEDSEIHPETDCPSSGDWLTVATNGRSRWVNCSQCDATWRIQTNETNETNHDAKKTS